VPMQNALAERLNLTEGDHLEANRCGRQIDAADARKQRQAAHTSCPFTVQSHGLRNEFYLSSDLA